MSRDTRETVFLVSFLVIVLLLKARKVYFSVTQWRHTPERRGRKKKSKIQER